MSTTSFDPAWQRRDVLRLPLVAVLPAVAGPGAQDDLGADEGPLAFERFAKRCEELAKAHQAGAGLDHETLLHRLADLGARLDPASVPRAALGRFGDYDPAVEFGPVHRAPPVIMIQWRLAPGAVLPAHNHTPGCVLSLCLEGECRVRHFELAGAAPAPGAPGDFRMRETHARVLRPGLSTSLSPERDNIHTFEAGPAGAFGVDVNVFLPGDGDWSMIDGFQGTREGYEKLHDARWTGKPG